MTTKKRHCQHPSTSFSDALLFQSLPDFLFMLLPDIFPFLSFSDALLFQSLPDLIGQSIILYLVFWGYSGYAFGIFNLQNKNYLLR